MKTINGYIGFNGQCREAMTFYHETLGGELVLNVIEGSPIEKMCPPQIKHQIYHSVLTIGNIAIMASDLSGMGGYIKGNNVGLTIDCSSEDEINDLYAKFSAEGTVLDALKVQFWGALFACLDDKFGIRWMLHYDKNQ